MAIAQKDAKQQQKKFHTVSYAGLFLLSSQPRQLLGNISHLLGPPHEFLTRLSEPGVAAGLLRDGSGFFAPPGSSAAALWTTHLQVERTAENATRNQKEESFSHPRPSFHFSETYENSSGGDENQQWVKKDSGG